MPQDNIEKILVYAETGERSIDIANNEPTEVYAAIDSLKENNPEKFLAWYTSAYEYRRAKLVRTTQHQTTEDIDIGY